MVVFHRRYHHNLRHKAQAMLSPTVAFRLGLRLKFYLCSTYQAVMSSPVTSTWSATEPMSLSLSAPMADLSPSSTRRIPTAAQRYYAQPRIGSTSNSGISPVHESAASLTERTDLAKGREPLEDEHEQKHDGQGEDTDEKQSRTKNQPMPISVEPLVSVKRSPTRHSPRVVRQRTAALGRMLQERLFTEFSPPIIKYRKNSRRLRVELMSDALPLLSEDPASYNSSTDDCRFHLPATIQDQLAIRAALTPTLFRLQKKGWSGSVVWNPDASYMEAHQKSIREYYKFEVMKDPDLDPSDLPPVLTLLPWYGRVSDFRKSPNWPEGW